MDAWIEVIALGGTIASTPRPPALALIGDGMPFEPSLKPGLDEPPRLLAFRIVAGQPDRFAELSLLSRRIEA